MKTLAELKGVINYPQSDEVLVNFLGELAERGLLIMAAEDIQGEGIAQRVFDQIVRMYGIEDE